VLGEKYNFQFRQIQLSIQANTFHLLSWIRESEGGLWRRRRTGSYSTRLKLRVILFPIIVMDMSLRDVTNLIVMDMSLRDCDKLNYVRYISVQL